MPETPARCPWCKEPLREQLPTKRPVAWRVKDLVFKDEAEAYAYAERTGVEMQGLYVRDGT